MGDVERAGEETKSKLQGKNKNEDRESETQQREAAVCTRA